MSNNDLIKEMISSGALRAQKLIDAFKKIDRKDFVLEELKENAYLDAPLPIGFNQTISQPSTVAFMLELLQPQEGQKILDIGSGSGWQTALLSEIVKQKGQVFAVEIVPRLKEFGEKNVGKYSFVKSGITKFICADSSKGLPKAAPFDRIIVAAYANEIPQELKRQLKIGGRLVMPIKNSIFLVERIGKDDFKKTEYPGFRFVPLIT